MKTPEQLVALQQWKADLNELRDYLCQAASLADRIQFRIPEIYDLMEVVEEELEEIATTM
jgi:hypothetical protein